MGKTILSYFKMKSLIILAFLISVAVAIPATSECERKTEVLQNALTKLAKKNLDIKLDCTACFDDFLAAVTDCFSITTSSSGSGQKLFSNPKWCLLGVLVYARF